MSIVNFFEWGMYCKEFKNEGSNTIQPITEFSFKWQTQVPDMFTFADLSNAGVICGIGEYRFEMKTSVNQATIQDFFKKQLAIKEIHFIRFGNRNGEIVEIERYTARKAIIGAYEFISKSITFSQSYKIIIYGTGKDEFVQTVRNNEGSVLGKLVTITDGSLIPNF